MRRAIHYCVRFHSFLYSRKMLMSGAPSSERASSRHQCTGYCVGSTRREFGTITSAATAANATIAAAQSAADFSAALSPRRDTSDSNDTALASPAHDVLVTRSPYLRPVYQCTRQHSRAARPSVRKAELTVANLHFNVSGF